MRTKNISMQQTNKKNQAGFSLMELLVALTITLVVMSIAVTMLARTLNVRTRENEHVDELGDVQRALNIMSREIANSGFNLKNPDNGIVAADSDAQRIRIRANLNKFNTTDGFTPEAKRGIGEGQPGEDKGEDVTYFVNTADNTNYLARWDELAIPPNQATVLANRVTSIGFSYFDRKVTYTQDRDSCQITNPLNDAGGAQAQVTPDNAKFVVILVCIITPEVGTKGSPGYQPEFRTLLISDVALRNSRLNKY
jgi:prepilin-type N-terminal cleavage/methylation domain-containing protein